MSFYKTFTTKDAIASISGSIRLVSKPILYFKLLYYIVFNSCIRFLFCAIHSIPKGVGFSHSFL